MSRRRYSRRRYSRRNQMDELGCIVNMFVLPIGIATALLFSKDPGKKKIGWYMVICMVAFGFMLSSGASAEASLVAVGIIIAVILILSFINSSQSSKSQDSVSKENTSQNNKSSLNNNVKENSNNDQDKHIDSKQNQIAEFQKVSTNVAEKKANHQDSSMKQKTKEQEIYQNNLVNHGHSSSDTIFDENLVLLETNGKRVYQKISNNKEDIKFSKSKITETEIKNDNSMISATLPRVYYSSVLDGVKKNHVPESYCKIMIEQIRNTNVKECPGVAWKDSERFYILPLIVGYPIYSWPIDQVFDIERLKIMNVNSDQTYLDLIDQPIADEYDGLMPEYFMGDIGVDTERYVLSNGVEVTYASGKILKEILGL